jgi:hypothetical protein
MGLAAALVADCAGTRPREVARVRIAPRASAEVIDPPPSRSAPREGPLRWSCERAEVSLPSAGVELDVPSAWIFSDAIVGASLLVRERRAREGGLEADVHFRNERGATRGRWPVTGPAALSAPWRIEDARLGVLRRCTDLDGCELRVIDGPGAIRERVGADAPVFALRAQDPAGGGDALVLAFVSGERALGRAWRSDAPATELQAAIDGDRALAGVVLRGREPRLVLRRREDESLIEQDGTRFALDAGPCVARATPSFGVVETRVAFGAMAPTMTLRAELGRRDDGQTCVKRLYGRGTLGLVDASVEVATDDEARSEGLVRTARAVTALRCHAER